VGKILFWLLNICIAITFCVPARVFAATIHTVDLATLINADRAQYHLPPLKIDARLTVAAQEKADDMSAKNYFAHISPDGKNPWYWFRNAGYEYRFAGENLAVGFSDSGDVEEAWMASAPHRGNILNIHYTQIGVAVSQGMLGGRLVHFVVVEFGASE
jgi:uncharacterized protein YkwD